MLIVKDLPNIVPPHNEEPPISEVNGEPVAKKSNPAPTNKDAPSATTIINYGVVQGGVGGAGGSGNRAGKGGKGGKGEGPRLISVADHIDQFIYLSAENVPKELKYVSARYNAAEITAEPCMKGTRVEIIRDIVDQLTRLPDPSLRLVVCSGPAGSGKSTVAKTIAECLDEKSLLAASFFFSRDYADRKELGYLPSTLAHQLADYDLEFRRLLVTLLEGDRNKLIYANPELQFQKMVVELLAKMPSSPTPWVICLDALDECGKDRGRILLQWLSHAIFEIPVHVRFFLTGRPEVRSYLKSDPLRSLTRNYSIEEIDPETAKNDIRLYVAQSLTDQTWDTPGGWRIANRDADEITSRANGLFIFAATAVRYVHTRSSDLDVHPQESVDHLLKGAHLNQLHEIYLQIIEEAIGIPVDVDQRVERIRKVLGAIVDLVEPQDVESLSGLLDIDVQELRRTLIRLSAVLHVPEEAGVIKIIHLSFREFLTGAIQAKHPELLCGTEVQRLSLALNTLRVMQKELRFNICDLPTSHLRNVDVDGLEERKRTYISGHLVYSCRFWVVHLTASHYTLQVAQIAGKFLLEHLLFWLEVLSLAGAVDSAVEALSNLIKWISEDPQMEETAVFARDAKRFISLFKDPIVASTPHIYLSALAFAPQQSKVVHHFRHQFPRLSSAGIGRLEVWPATVSVLEKHTGWVWSVAFSADGKRVVSAYDQTVCVWDWESGEVVAGPFEGHTEGVTSVVFSADGMRIVSGSYDQTVRVWDSESGEVVAGPFEGHTGGVTSVALSADGKRIVSGSYDQTVRMWDSESGEVVAGPFKGHTGGVTSVAFSADGKRIVSGSSDETVRVWDSESGEVVAGPFEGHTDGVTSVAFSADDKRIVSGSSDQTVRVWDSESGEVVAGPFEGHTGGVTSVALSADGKRIVSGSSDLTVRVWDSESGEVVAGPFEGHTDGVTSVGFSADGKWIVSGSDDQTVRVWDSESEEAGLFNGHTDGVSSVAFSADGKRIVSGSYDQTVCVWDSENGEVVAGPFEGHTDGVASVAFSADGKRIVSGSYDQTVRVWDSESGEVVAGPFEGHTDGVTSVAFSADGKRIVSGSYDQTVRVWDSESGEVVAGPFEGHTGWVTSVAFSADGKRIVSGSDNQTVCVWDSESGVVVAGPFEGHTGGVTSVAFSADGKRIVSGSSDQTVRVWDSESGEVVVGPFEGHTDWVTSVAFSADGKRIVSGSSDLTVRVWDSESGEVVAGPFEGHTGGVTSVAFLADGKRIVSGSDDQTVRVWDSQSGEVVAGPLEGHTGEVTSVPLPPDGEQIPSRRNHSSRSWFLALPPTHPVARWSLTGGWLSSRPSELLIWLPSPLRTGLWSPLNTLVIGRRQTTLILDNFVHGTEWLQCYQPE